MTRILICLPLCLLLAPNYPGATLLSASRPTERVYIAGPTTSDGVPDPGKDIFGFFEACLKRYNENVKGYTLSFRKQERTLGTLNPWETIEVCYQEKPHCVFFDWQEGARLVIKALYVEGENKNANGKSQLLALPAVTLLGVQKRDTDSPDSKKSGRYPLSEFGLKQAMQRVVDLWKEADAEKTLHVEYLGLHKVPEVGGQLCHKIRRHSFARPEGDDGVTEVILYVDRETLFQVGSIVKGADEQMLGEYYFREIHLNPVFEPGQFTSAVLKVKR